MADKNMAKCKKRLPMLKKIQRMAFKNNNHKPVNLIKLF